VFEQFASQTVCESLDMVAAETGTAESEPIFFVDFQRLFLFLSKTFLSRKENGSKSGRRTAILHLVRQLKIRFVK
jgi:hypothetical protein